MSATRQQLVAFAAGLAGLALWFKARCDLAGVTRRLMIAEVKCLAEKTVNTYFGGVDPMMLRAMVEIESAREPTAFRAEPHIGDGSMGIMQTLLGNAQESYDIGFTAKGRPEKFEDLADPEVSMYFGAAYVNRIRAWRGRSRSEEWIVRAYNGGPGGATKSYTQGHWDRYIKAKQRLAKHDGQGATFGF